MWFPLCLSCVFACILVHTCICVCVCVSSDMVRYVKVCYSASNSLVEDTCLCQHASRLCVYLCVVVALHLCVLLPRGCDTFFFIYLVLTRVGWRTGLDIWYRDEWWCINYRSPSDSPQRPHPISQNHAPSFPESWSMLQKLLHHDFKQGLSSPLEPFLIFPLWYARILHPQLRPVDLSDRQLVGSFDFSFIG